MRNVPGTDRDEGELVSYTPTYTPATASPMRPATTPTRICRDSHSSFASHLLTEDDCDR